MANYGTIAGFKAYHDERGNDYSAFTDPEITAALVRASTYIDTRYRGRFPGEPSVSREDGGQDLEWPRVSSWEFGALEDIYGAAIPENSTPVEVLNATYEIALREAATPGIMFPDVKLSDRKLSVTVVGAVSVTYANNTSIESYRTTVTIADGILAPILTGVRSGSSLAGETYRG